MFNTNKVIRAELKKELVSFNSAILIVKGRKGYMLEKYGWNSELLAADQACEYALTLQASSLAVALSRANYGKKFVPNLEKIIAASKREVVKLTAEMAQAQSNADHAYLSWLVRYYTNFADKLSGLIA